MALTSFHDTTPPRWETCPTSAPTEKRDPPTDSGGFFYARGFPKMIKTPKGCQYCGIWKIKLKQERGTGESIYCRIVAILSPVPGFHFVGVECATRLSPVPGSHRMGIACATIVSPFQVSLCGMHAVWWKRLVSMVCTLGGCHPRCGFGGVTANFRQ